MQVLQCEVERLLYQQKDTQQKYDMAFERNKEIETELDRLDLNLDALQQHARSSGASQTWTDGRRDEMYLSAIRVGEQLRKLDKDLNDTIAQINRSNEALDHGSDPVSVITRTLNLQLQSLKWIESQSTQIDDKLNQLQSHRK